MYWVHDRVLSTRELSSGLSKASNATVGFSITVRTWRHLNQLIQFELIVPNNSSALIQEVIALHSTHTIKVAKSTYGVSDLDRRGLNRDALKKNVLMSAIHQLVSQTCSLTTFEINL